MLRLVYYSLAWHTFSTHGRYVQLKNMYRFDTEMNFDSATGQCITQFRIGQYDFQFSIGDIHFGVQSTIKLFRDDILIGVWEQNQFPDSSFKEIFNVEIENVKVIKEDLTVIKFRNNIEMHLVDEFDDYESMTIILSDGTYYVI